MEQQLNDLRKSLEKITRIANEGAKSALTGENVITLNIGDTTLHHDIDMNLNQIGVQVDAHSDMRPFKDDSVIISLWLGDREDEAAYFDLSIKDARRLATTILFQCSVAEIAQRKKRQILQQSYL